MLLFSGMGISGWYYYHNKTIALLQPHDKTRAQFLQNRNTVSWSYLYSFYYQDLILHETFIDVVLNIDGSCNYSSVDHEEEFEFYKTTEIKVENSKWNLNNDQDTKKTQLCIFGDQIKKYNEYELMYHGPGVSKTRENEVNKNEIIKDVTIIIDIVDLNSRGKTSKGGYWTVDPEDFKIDQVYLSDPSTV